MPRKSYPLAENSSKKVELHWKRAYRDLRVLLDGEELGVLADAPAAKVGKTWTLEDDSKLSVRLHNTNFTGGELQVLLDGVPLPNSPSDPKSRLRTASNWSFFIAIVSIFFGTVVMYIQQQTEFDLIDGMASVGYGAAFIGLGMGIRKGSTIALILAIALYAFDTVSTVYFGAIARDFPGIWFFILRSIIFMSFAKAYPAMKLYRERRVFLAQQAGGATSGSSIGVSLGNYEE